MRAGVAAAILAAAVAGALLARPAAADVSGHYDGQMVVKRPAQTIPVTGTLTQSGADLSGTIVFDMADTGLTGAYAVTGRVGKTRLRVKGPNPVGAVLTWSAKIAPTGLSGAARIKNKYRHLAGAVALTASPTGGGGGNCDAVYAANQAFFDGEVMAHVLVPICANCHVAGGAAQSTRLRVTPSDPLATARTTILLIDTQDPASSRLLNKPTARVPHGGGPQILAGSPEEQILTQWVDLVAGAGCATGGPPDDSPEGLFANDCAGCHGADAKGGGGRPDIRCAVHSRLLNAVRSGRGPGQSAMPAFSTQALDDASLAKIEGLLQGWCSGLPGDVFASNCVTCHGATAGGSTNADGVSGPNIRCQSTWDFVEKVTQGSDAMPAFPELLPAHATSIAGWVQQSFCGLNG